MSEGSLAGGKEIVQQAGAVIKEGTTYLANKAGNDLLKNASRTGKGVLITWWILLVAVFIYMIVLAIIYYNEYTKYTLQDDDTYKYCKDKSKQDECEEWNGLTEEEIITWNIHKTVMNGLLTFMNLFGIYIVLFGIGSIAKPDKDVCGSDQLGWLCLLNIIWFIVNMVWDIKNSQYTATAAEIEAGSNDTTAKTESFCGMMETFCGSITEGFANVSKKLRKF